MTQTPLDELIAKYLDRMASEAEVAELSRRLREDPRAADAFARACRLDAWLSRRFRHEKEGQHVAAALEALEWGRRRHWRGLRWAGVAAAAAAVALLAWWAFLVWRYPEPMVTGSVSIRQGGAVRRGAIIEAGAPGATLALGGYCRLKLDPGCVVRLAGAPHRERIVLERGRVVCEIQTDRGDFEVQTPLCTVSAKGTRFAVELVEGPGGQAMMNRHVLVRVFAGAVVVVAAAAQEVVRAGEEKLVGDPVVITAENLSLEVGGTRRYAIAAPDGRRVAQMDMALLGKRKVGDTTLCRAAVRFGTTRVNDVWITVGKDGYAVFGSLGAELPLTTHPLPLKEGMTFEYESPQGHVKARVVGTEVVEVPVGKFACLKVETRHRLGDREVTRTSWLAPVLGVVKEVREDAVLTLERAQGPPKPRQEKGVTMVSTFDTGDLLASPVFPGGRWGGWKGAPGQSSRVEIDPFDGAEGSPFSLRWTYTALGSWVSTSISAATYQPVDLSRYKGISFYVKGLLERPCTFTVVARGAKGEPRAIANIPIGPLSRQWQKVIITPETHRQLLTLDLRQVYSIGLSTGAREEAAHNVVWLDQIRLHEDEKELREEMEALENVRRLLEEGKRGQF